jgi:hypothetical protein
MKIMDKIKIALSLLFFAGIASAAAIGIEYGGYQVIKNKGLYISVSSGIAALSIDQDTRINIDGLTGSKYLSSDGSNLSVTGVFLQSSIGLKVQGAFTLQDSGANSLRYMSHKGDSANVIAHEFVTAATYSNTSSKLVSVKNNTTEQIFINKDGAIKINVVGTVQPTCDSTTRGLETRLNGDGAGIPDQRLICIQASDGNFAWRSMISTEYMSIFSAFVNAVTTATTTYGAYEVPSGSPGPLQINGFTFKIRTAGSGGTSNATYRVTDGSTTCDATLACNAASDTYSLIPVNGSGACTFAAGAEVEFQVQGIGDCAVGPDILGNVTITGHWNN